MLLQVLWHVLSCSVVAWLCIPWLFPAKPLVQKLMQVMQVAMAAFPVALQGLLSKDVLASCYFDLRCVCVVCPSRFLLVTLLLQYLVPVRAAASHVKPPTWKKAVRTHLRIAGLCRHTCHFLTRETNEPECSHIKHFRKTSFYQQSCTFFSCCRTSVDCWVWNGLECRVWSVKTVKTVECWEGNVSCRLWTGDCVKCRV